MDIPKLATVLVVMVVSSVGCTSRSHPEMRLLGKWQSDANKAGLAVQFEFLADGTAIKNQRLGAASNGKWQQLGTGTFKFIDPTHVKLELQPSWYVGVSIYEVIWLDNDHVGLRAADDTIQLSRLK